MKTECLYALAIALLSTEVFSQDTFVNRIFENDFGTPVFNPALNQFGIQWCRSINCASGEIITVG
jgi:hypothetical protein